MDGLWTNSNALRDFFRNGIDEFYRSASEIYIAVAFFTDEQIVQEMLSSGCYIRMVVRLGFPTKPDALNKLIDKRGMEIRYYSDCTFHPKLYIFGDKVALLGSANLTKSALATNQEIVVSVKSEDHRFSELSSLFSGYWDNAEVLTPEALATYKDIYERYGEATDGLFHMEKAIQQSKLGKIVFPNINRGKQKKSKENIFLSRYRATYQETCTAFGRIRSVYESLGERKKDFASIPIRLEIDSFLSYARNRYAPQESWREQSIGWSDEKKQLLQAHIREWLKADYPHGKKICRENYPLITKVFGSAESITKASDREIVDALVVLHSFHDRLRFYDGGLETLKKSFIQTNGPDSVKSSLIHLLFGEGDIVNRMADLIYDRAYKLDHFGPANVQELIGWINREDLPVINGRTTKVLRYYGFDIKQL